MTNREKQLAELNKILGAVASIKTSKREGQETPTERQEREKWEKVDREWDRRFD